MLNRRRPVLTAAASVAALALLLTGCGGDDADSNESGGTALTDAEFREQADALCVASDQEMEALGDGLSEESSEAEVLAFLKTGVERTRELADDIDALEEPSDLSDEVDAMLASVRAAADLIEEKGLEMMAAEEDPFEDANEKAVALGLEECGT